VNLSILPVAPRAGAGIFPMGHPPTTTNTTHHPLVEVSDLLPELLRAWRWLPEVTPRTSHHIYGAAFWVLLTVLSALPPGNTPTALGRPRLRPRQQPWRLPTAPLSSSRTTLSCLSPCWINPTIPWPTIQPQMPVTSVQAATACLPPPRWTLSASPPPPSRPPEANRMRRTVSSSKARQCLASPRGHS